MQRESIIKYVVICKGGRMKKFFMFLFVVVMLIFTGCGTTSNDETNTTTTIEENIVYPLKKKLGSAWGYNWAKITAFYDGDTRYTGNDVELHNDNEYIVLRAYKKNNQDSRAQVSSSLPYVKGFNAKVNLFNDNVYSQFQVLAIAKGYIETSEPIGDLNNTSGLSFIAGLTIQKNKIIYWWDIYDLATGKDYDGDVGQTTYDYNLTSLVEDGSDIEVEVTSNDSNVTYKVYNLANEDVIFEKTLNLSDIKITNFNGFNIASFRSRVRDDKANENGDEAIDKSENIVNDFEAAPSTSNISSVDDFLDNLDFDPVAITNDDLSNKLIITGGGSLMYFSSDNKVERYKNEKKEEGEWNIEKNVLIIEMERKAYVAIQNKAGSQISIKGYDGKWFTDNSLLLNATKDTTITDENDFLALFENNTSIDTLKDDDVEGKTWTIDDNNLTFDSDGTFTDTWKDDDGTTHTKTGKWDVNNNVLILTFDEVDDGGIKSIYIVLVDGRKVFLGIDNDNLIKIGGIEE
jgi:hypothetical protein